MEELQPWIIGTGVSIVMALFVKYCPKGKLLQWIEKPCRGFGVAVSKFLVLRLGRKAAEKVEEGIIVTLLTVIGKAPLFVVDGLLADNEKKKQNANIGDKK